MRTIKIPPPIFALAVFVVAGACGREAAPPAAGQTAQTAQPGQSGAAAPGAADRTAAAPAIPAPPASELQPHPQSVVIGNAPPPPPPPADQRREADLEARERRLEARQAALEAREEKLRHHDGAPPQARPQPADAAANAPGAETEPPPYVPTESPAAPEEPGGGAAAAAGGGAGAEGGGMDAAGGAAGGGAPVAGTSAAAETPSSDQPRVPVRVPTGTQFEVAFTKALASNTSSNGDVFRTRLLSDVKIDGGVAIPAGSEILGVVTEAVGARRIGGKAKLSLKFTDLVLPSGTTVPVHISFLEEGRGKAGRDAATIGGATAGGALLGRLLGQSGKGTILGALVGAAVGTAVAAKTSGEEVVIPEGSVVKLKLDEPIDVKPRRAAGTE